MTYTEYANFFYWARQVNTFELFTVEFINTTPGDCYEIDHGYCLDRAIG